MTRTLRLAVLVGAMTLGTAGSADATFYNVSITTGFGPTGLSSLSNFNFGTAPYSSDLLGITLSSGVGMAQVGTGGGTLTVGPNLPVQLDFLSGTGGFPSSRGAYFASTNVPPGFVPVDFALVPAPPLLNQYLPVGTPLLITTLSAPSDGVQVLTVSAVDPSVPPIGMLGSGIATMPVNGWWEVSIWAEAMSFPTFPPDEPPVIDPGPPVFDPGAPASTPEPATLALVALGLPIAGAARWLRRKQ
jgi:hypothetical protein